MHKNALFFSKIAKIAQNCIKRLIMRKLKRLNEYAKHENANQTAFEQCSASV